MDEEFLRRAETVWREHMESAVSDPRLREILTPDSRFGCRRPVVSNSFYPALPIRKLPSSTRGYNGSLPQGLSRKPERSSTLTLSYSLQGSGQQKCLAMLRSLAPAGGH